MPLIVIARQPKFQRLWALVRMLSGKVQKKYPPCKKVFIRVGVNQDNDFYFNLPSDFANPKRKNLQKANTCVEQAGLNFFDKCIFSTFWQFSCLLEPEFKSISFPSQLRSTNRYPLKQMLPTQWDFHVVLFQIWIYGGPIHILPLNWCEYPLNGQLAQT